MTQVERHEVLGYRAVLHAFNAATAELVRFLTPLPYVERSR